MLDPLAPLVGVGRPDLRRPARDKRSHPYLTSRLHVRDRCKPATPQEWPAIRNLNLSSGWDG